MKVDKKKLTKVVLEIVDENSWSEREVYWISHFNSTDRIVGYNLMDGGQGVLRLEKNGMYGKTHTDKVKEENRNRNLELYKREPERLLAISKDIKGKEVSDEFREKRRIVMLGSIPKE